MFCKNCGNGLPNTNAKFCPICGQPAEVPVYNPPKKSMTPIIIIISIIAVALIGVGVFLFLDSPQEQGQDDTGQDVVLETPAEDEVYDEEPEIIEPTLPASNIAISWLIEPIWDFDAVFPFNYGLAGVEFFEERGEWWSEHILGYINRYGETVIPIRFRHYPETYEYMGAPSFGYGRVAVFSNEHDAVGIFDEQGNVISDFEYGWAWTYSEGLIAVGRDGRWGNSWGFMDLYGNIVIDFQFEFAGDFSEGLAPVVRDNRWGFINRAGEVVIPFIFDRDFDPWMGFEGPPPQFENGFARVMQLNDAAPTSFINYWDLINPQGEPLTGFIYDFIGHFHEDRAIVRRLVSVSSDHPNRIWNEYGEELDYAHYFGFIDRTGYEVIPAIYSWVADFSYGRAVVSRDGFMGFIDLQGNEVINPIYTTVFGFSEGLSVVSTGDWGANYIGFIDIYGNEVIPQRFSMATNFSEGRAAVSLGSWPDIQWGFIDRDGNEVVDIKYDHVRSFENGVAPVAFGQWEWDPITETTLTPYWGLIDMYGNEVFPIILQELHPFSDGLAWAKFEGLWGILQIHEE